MFSTMQHQKRAEELIDDAKNLVSSIDERFAKAKERLEKKLAEIDALRSQLIKQTLAKFRKRFESIENEPAIELTPVAEAPLGEQLQPLYEKSDIEPVEIKDVRGGKGGAFFVSLLAALLTVAVALLIGAVGTGQPVAKETFTDILRLEKILAWLSGGAFDPDMGSPVFGIVVLAIAAIAAWMIAWSIMMAKSARRNLQTAEGIYGEAEKYHEVKNRYAQALDELADELDKLGKILETCDIYMQEFNAVLQRIIHTEGSDFEAYRNPSKDAVKRATECAEALIPLLNIAIVTTEGTPSRQLSDAITHGEKIVLALMENHPMPKMETSEQEQYAEEGLSLPPESEEAAESLEIETKEEGKIL
ncbi:hypothetical protein [Hydrogenimonas urashimensis]|uniref:hypothetical protein n=1 Tax=Hydrogenimonas urashimensis TaxID=2740515 RepID=UPI001915A3B9|nr:hypothetical protein [Hydrogenimonas urashimensis]